MQRYKIIVKGIVQGVGFRYHTQKTATNLNIQGYVKNLADGSVYIEAQGNGLDLTTFLDWVRIGPAHAEVRHFKKEEIPLNNTENSFTIR